MRDQRRGELRQQLRCRGDQRRQVVLDAYDQVLQDLNAGVKKIIRVVAQILGQLDNDAGGGAHDHRDLLRDAVHQTAYDGHGSVQHGGGAVLRQNGGQGGDRLCCSLCQHLQRRLHLVVDRQLQTFQRRLHDGDSALQVVQLGVCHLTHSVTGVVDLGGQSLPLIALRCQQAVDGGEVGLIEQRIDDAVLIALRHAVHDRVQVGEDVVQLAHIALGIVDLQPQLLHDLPGVLSGRLQRQNDIAQVGAAFSALDAHVGQQTEGGCQLCGTTLQVCGGTADRQNGFTQLGNVGVRLTGSHSQFVAELVYVLLAGFDIQRGHGIGDQIRRIGQIHAACSSKVQHAGQDLGGLVCIVACQRQIIQRVRCLCSGERGSSAHLLGGVGQVLDLIDTGAHGGCHLRHGRIKAHAHADRDLRETCQLAGGCFGEIRDQSAGGHRHAAEPFVKATSIQFGITSYRIVCQCVHLS